MPMKASRCCAPSCRSRSIWRRRASAESTAAERVASSEVMRAVSSSRPCGESIDSASAASSQARPRVASTATANRTMPASGARISEAGAASPSVEPSGAQIATSGAAKAVIAAEYSARLTDADADAHPAEPEAGT